MERERPLDLAVQQRQVVEQRLHTVNRLLDTGQQIAARRGVIASALAQHMHGGAHSTKRPTQFVNNVCQRAAACLLQHPQAFCQRLTQCALRDRQQDRPLRFAQTVVALMRAGYAAAPI